MLMRVGVGHTMPLAFLSGVPSALYTVCFLTNVNSLAFDYVARQKIGGTHMTYAFPKQLPVLPPDAYALDNASVFL